LPYLTNLVDLVSERADLNHERQRGILLHVERALRSFDPGERRGGRDVLQRMAVRPDLYADIDRGLGCLRSLSDQPESADVTPSRLPRSATS
jgi:hypothetical protein